MREHWEGGSNLNTYAAREMYSGVRDVNWQRAKRTVVTGRKVSRTQAQDAYDAARQAERDRTKKKTAVMYNWITGRDNKVKVPHNVHVVRDTTVYAAGGDIKRQMERELRAMKKGR